MAIDGEEKFDQNDVAEEEEEEESQNEGGAETDSDSDSSDSSSSDSDSDDNDDAEDEEDEEPKDQDGDTEMKSNGVANGELEAEEEEEPQEEKEEIEEGGDIMSAFWDLADPEKTARFKAVANLIGNKNVRKLDTPDHVYTLKRLVRGLSSSRGVARQGFVVALTQLLRSVQNVDISELIKFLIESTTVTKSHRGHEERERWFGRLFGFMAICRGAARIGTQPENVLRMMSESVEISKKKTWIEEMAHETASDAISRVEKASILMQIISELDEKVHFDGETVKDLSAANLSLVCSINLTVRNCQDDKLEKRKNVMKKFATVKEILQFPNKFEEEDDTYLNHMMKALVQSSSTCPRLHSVWAKVIKLVNSNGPKDLKLFWAKVCASMLVDASAEKRYTTLRAMEQIVKELVASNNAEYIADVVFQPDMVRFLGFTATAKTKTLNKVTVDAVEKVARILHTPEVPSSARLSIAGSIREISPKGSTELIKIIETGTVNGKVSLSCDSTAEVELSTQKSAFEQHCKNEQIESWALATMFTILKQVKDTQMRWRLTVDLIKYLAEKSMFHNSQSNFKVPRLLQGAALQMLRKLLVELTNLEASVYEHVQRQEQENEYWSLEWDPAAPRIGRGIKEVNLHIEKLFKDKSQKFILEEPSEPQLVARKAALNLSKKAEVSTYKDSKTSCLSFGLQLYLQHLALQTLILGEFDGSTEVNLDVVDVLDDLVKCAKRLLKQQGLELEKKTRAKSRRSKRKNREKKEEEEDDDDDDDDDEMDEDAPAESAILVDLMIATLAQPSTLLRAVVQKSFQYCATIVDADALDTIFEVILSKNVGDESQTNESKEMEIDLEEEEEEEEENDDADDEDEDDGADSQKKEVVAEEEEEEEEEDDDDEKETIDRKAQQIDPESVKDVLAEAAALFEDDEDEDDPSVQEMRKYDNALSAFVKATLDAKKNTKDEKFKAEQEKTDLKLRIMDLIQVYAETQKLDSTKILMLVPLVRAANMCVMLKKPGRTEKFHTYLLNRVKRVLKTIAKQKKTDMDKDTMLDNISPDGICFDSLDSGSQQKKSKRLKALNLEENDGKLKLEEILPRIVRICIDNAMHIGVKSAYDLSIDVAQFAWRLALKLEILSLEEVAACYKDLLEGFLVRNDGHLKAKTLEPLFDPGFPIGWLLVPDLCEMSELSTKLQNKIMVLETLSFSLRGKMQVETIWSQGPMLLKAASAYLSKGLSSSLKGKTSKEMFKAANVRHVFALLNGLHRIGRKNDKEFSDLENSDMIRQQLIELVAKCDEFQRRIVPAEASVLLKKIFNEQHDVPKKPGKRKREEEEEEEEEEEKVEEKVSGDSKKAKKNANNRPKKKQKKSKKAPKPGLKKKEDISKKEKKKLKEQKKAERRRQTTLKKKERKAAKKVGNK